jgi:capsular polysaccharide transport system permease protein
MTFARGGANQLQVIHAVALRETRTRFGAHQLGYLWAIAEPVVWILTFFILFSVTGSRAPVGMDLFTFLATGLIGYNLVMQVADRISKAIDGNRSLLVYPHVQPLDLVAARAWLEAGTLVMVFALLVAGYGAATGIFEVDDLLEVIIGFSLAAGLGAGLGLVFCALDELAPIVERVRGPLLRPLFWISGIYFTAGSLPSRIRDALLWNPILNCIEIIRAGFFKSYDAPYASPSYVAGWVVALFFFGLTLERVVRRRIQVG